MHRVVKWVVLMNVVVVNWFIIVNGICPDHDSPIRLRAYRHGHADDIIVTGPSEFGCGVAKLKNDQNGTTLFPASDLTLQPGDTIVVQGPYETMISLKERRGHLQDLESAT